MSQGRKLNPYYPFDSELQYLMAKDLSTPTLHPQNDIERVAVHGKYVKDEARFDSYRHFIEKFDEMLRCQSLWQSYTFADATNSTPWSTGMRYWCRDTLAVLQEMLENPALADKCVWQPEKNIDGNGDRIYTDLHDSDWWWKMQVLP